jgi:hypothetical protein
MFTVVRLIAAAAMLVTMVVGACAGKIFCDFNGYTVEPGAQPATLKACNGGDCKTVPIKWSKEPPAGIKDKSIFNYFTELDAKHYIATIFVRDSAAGTIYTDFTRLVRHDDGVFLQSTTCEGELVEKPDPDDKAPLFCSAGSQLEADGAVQHKPGGPIETGLMAEQKVPDTGAAVIDLGNGASLLREGPHARLITPLYGAVTCHTGAGFNFRAVDGSRPLSDPGIDVEDAYARAKAYAEALDMQVREADERKRARDDALNAQMAANTKCAFADGSTVERGIFHTPGHADTRARFYLIGGKNPEINYFGGDGLGTIDHRTGGAGYNVYADERTKKKEKHVLGSCSGVPTPEPDPD